MLMPEHMVQDAPSASNHPFEKFTSNLSNGDTAYQNEKLTVFDLIRSNEVV